MSDPVTVAVATIGAGLLGAASSQVASRRQARAQNRAAQQQKELADRQIALESEAANRANARKADISSLLDGNSVADVGETNLTGAQGQIVDDSLLGRNTTLGA